MRKPSALHAAAPKAAKKSVAKAPAKKTAAPTAKKGATKTAPKATAHPAAAAAVGGHHTPVRVRMYRQGLGDCFLVTFDPGGKEVHMLIDCGTLGASTTGNKLEDIVAHIRATTGDHVHLLIATHEHQDHVSGFHTLKKEFQKISVDHVWMAWTENPADEFAQGIQKFKGDLGEAVALAAQSLAKNPAGDTGAPAMGEAMKSLLGFVGDLDVLGAAKIATTVDDGMTFVRTGQQSSPGVAVNAEYHKPGGPALEPAWIPGFRFYVLGPPRNLDRLKEMGEDGSPEIYGLAASLKAGVDDPAAAPAIPDETEMPFDARFRFASDDALVQSKLASYFDPANQWRRVDTEWLHGAADLALQLDNLTNNTSLALAIERISDGKVLLFPADAQQGHWLSWHEPEIPFSFVQAGVKHETTAEKLLDQTVFYKVGHHASHNATARGKGLELMHQEKDLVAFIPLDRMVALGRSPQGQWKMPAKALYRRLLEKCQGRVARSDIGWAVAPADAKFKDVEENFKDTATPAEWAQWKRSQDQAPVKIETLFIDYTLS